MRAIKSKTHLIGPEMFPEQFIAEHLFFYLIEGSLSGYYGSKNYTLNAGEYGIVRKNQLGRYDGSRGTEEIEKIILVFDEPFLKTFQEKQKTTTTKFKPTEPFLKLSDNKLIPGFVNSLTPYYNNDGQIDKAFVDVQREELLLILLKLQPELAGVFFDYGIPAKINLEEFMNRNYRFNVSLERFAFLTGRSLSAFKRDFEKVFNTTPSRWLIEKRLQEAHFLIENNGKKPSDIYLDLGFEDLSHFSFAFKKLFGQAPTEILERKE